MSSYPCIFVDYGGGDWRPLKSRLELRMAVWLQAKVRDHGFGCGLGSMPALSVTTAPLGGI